MWPCAVVAIFTTVEHPLVTVSQVLLFMHYFDGCLGSFQFGAIMTTAAMNNPVYILWSPHACISVAHTPGSGIAMS